MGRMPSKRTFVLALAALGLVVVVTAATFLLSRDEPAEVRGELIAYGCKEQKNPWYGICVMRSDGTERQRLTSKLATTDPDWSPNGRQIAFTRNEDVGESTLFTSDDVFVMDSDGDDVHRLTPERPGRSSGQPTWSPDAREIVYVHGPSVSSAVPSRFGALFLVEVDGQNARRLTTGRADTDPDWSPDGSEIVFVRGRDLASPTESNMDVHVLELATGKTRPLTNTPPGVFETAPAWSPDGSRVAFARWGRTSQFTGAAKIYVVSRDGTGEELVLAHRLFANGPYGLAWSPDGRTIAFEMSSMIGCTAIAITLVDTRKPRYLTKCARPIDSTVAPSWQPAVDPPD